MRVPSFKLFIWRDILEQYGLGFAFAYARNVDEARNMILEQMRSGMVKESDIEHVKGEPDEIIITPCAELVRGSA
jgi:hypothetical protein